MTTSTSSALLVVPANNTTMEPELRALCPQFAAVTVARVSLPPEGVNRDNLDRYTQTTLRTIDRSAPDHLDVVVYGCTAAGFLAGPEASGRLADVMRRRTNATVIATATAMVDVLNHEGVTETAVVTPYLKPVNDGLRAYLEAADISVEVIHSRECRTVEELGRLGEDDVFDMVLNAVTPTTHSVFVACSQLPTLGILEPLRERLGIPVWSSVSATAWACRRALAGTVASGAP